MWSKVPCLRKESDFEDPHLILRSSHRNSVVQGELQRPDVGTEILLQLHGELQPVAETRIKIALVLT